MEKFFICVIIHIDPTPYSMTFCIEVPCHVVSDLFVCCGTKCKLCISGINLHSYLFLPHFTNRTVTICTVSPQMSQLNDFFLICTCQ